MKRMCQFCSDSLRSFRLNRIAFVFFVVVGSSSAVFAQFSEFPLKMFGYFQTNYTQYNQREEEYDDAKSFSMQQLNLFLQKDLDRNLTTFVNFEFLNSYSSGHQWGSFSIEEAWIRYHRCAGFNLRVGLQTPTFNYLNEIKNRTPLMPYVIRPLVYESSFNEILRLEEYLPARAYIQMFGYIPKGAAKLDYAVYVGNSPNVNSDPEHGQTGVDTTDTFLVGGRLGLRVKEFNMGFSASDDKYDFPQRIVSLLDEKEIVSRLPRIRIGGDFRYTFSRFGVESEFIRVNYEDDLGGFDVDLRFYYATLFCDVTDQIRVYGSYWLAKERQFLKAEMKGLFGNVDTVTVDLDYRLEAPTFGAAYTMTDKIVIKVQVAPVTQKFKWEGSNQRHRFHYFAAALSVFL